MNSWVYIIHSPKLYDKPGGFPRSRIKAYIRHYQCLHLIRVFKFAMLITTHSNRRERSLINHTAIQASRSIQLGLDISLNFTRPAVSAFNLHVRNPGIIAYGSRLKH